jgi:hypothetical protein
MAHFGRTQPGYTFPASKCPRAPIPKALDVEPDTGVVWDLDRMRSEGKKLLQEINSLADRKVKPSIGTELVTKTVVKRVDIFMEKIGEAHTNAWEEGGKEMLLVGFGVDEEGSLPGVVLRVDWDLEMLSELNLRWDLKGCLL